MFGRPYALTQAQIEAIMDAEIGAQTVSWRFRLLDRETLHGVATGSAVDVNGYLDTADLGEAINASGISQDRSSEDVQRQLQGFNLKISDAPFIDTYHHYIQVVCTYWSGPDRAVRLFERPMGVFALTVDNRSIRATGHYLDATLNDWTTELAQLELLHPYTVTVDTLVTDAVKQALTANYLPNDQPGGTGATPTGLPYCGPNLPFDRINITPATDITESGAPVTFFEDRTWDRGASVLTMINEMLELPSYAKVWSDSFGVLQIHPKPNLSKDRPPFDRQYDTTVRFNIMDNVDLRQGNLAELGNIYHLHAEPADSDPIDAEARNDTNLDSALAIPNLRRCLPKSEMNNNIVDQELLQRAADIGLQEITALEVALDLKSLPDPWSESGDILDVTVYDPENPTGAPLVSSAIGWTEETWDVDFASRTQSHTMRKRYVV